MRHRDTLRATACVLAALLLSAAPSAAQNPTAVQWENKMARSTKALRAGDYERALKLSSWVVKDMMESLGAGHDVPLVGQGSSRAGPDVAEPQLDRRIGLPPGGQGQPAGLLHPPAGVVRSAEAAHPAVRDQPAEGLDLFGQRHGTVLGVGPEQVHPVDVQPAQAGFDARADAAGGQALG